MAQLEKGCLVATNPSKGKRLPSDHHRKNHDIWPTSPIHGTTCKNFQIVSFRYNRTDTEFVLSSINVCSIVKPGALSAFWNLSLPQNSSEILKHYMKLKNSLSNIWLHPSRSIIRATYDQKWSIAGISFWGLPSLYLPIFLEFRSIFMALSGIIFFSTSHRRSAATIFLFHGKSFSRSSYLIFYQP